MNLTYLNYRAIRIISIYFLIIFISCNLSRENRQKKDVAKIPGVPVMQMHATGPTRKQLKNDTTYYLFREKYLVMDLSVRTDGKFSASHTYVMNIDLDGPSEVKWISVVDRKKKRQLYDSNLDFLNYIDSRGYKMTNVDESQYKYSYTFERKD